MNKHPLLLSSLALALAGALTACGGSDSSDLAATANTQNASGDAANLKATANAADAQKITCASPSASAATSGSGKITADTPSADKTRLFPSGSTFKLAITTRAGSRRHAQAGRSPRRQQDGRERQLRRARVGDDDHPHLHVDARRVTSPSRRRSRRAAARCRPPARGRTASRRSACCRTSPARFPAVTYAHQEQHRFGMQGFNGNGPMLAALGITSTIDDRQMSVMEPNGRNTFNPSANNLDPFYTSGKVMRLVRLDGIPGWASGHGLSPDYGYAPVDLNYFSNYLGRVGTETEAIRARYFPTQRSNYYQVTWEPYILWKDTDANFVALYKAAYQGLHSKDPNAVVMGPAEPFPSLTTDRLKRLAPLGYRALHRRHRDARLLRRGHVAVASAGAPPHRAEPGRCRELAAQRDAQPARGNGRRLQAGHEALRDGNRHQL